MLQVAQVAFCSEINTKHINTVEAGHTDLNVKLVVNILTTEL